MSHSLHRSSSSKMFHRSSPPKLHCTSAECCLEVMPCNIKGGRRGSRGIHWGSRNQMGWMGVGCGRKQGGEGGGGRRQGGGGGVRKGGLGAVQHARFPMPCLYCGLRVLLEAVCGGVCAQRPHSAR